MTIHPRLSVNELCSWHQTFVEDVEMWDALGIDHVGLVLSKVEAFGWDGAATLLARHEIRVSTIAGPLPDIGTVRGESDAVPREATVLEAVEFAARIGAGSVYLGTGGAAGLSWDDAARSFAEIVTPARERARILDVALAIEPTNPLRCDRSFVFTLRDAVDLARLAGVTVCADFQSCWLERDLHATFAANVDAISLVQVSDYVVGTFDTPNRAVPGDGDMPVRDLLAMALNAGYEGPFDLEVLGPRVEAERYSAAIARSVRAVSTMLDEIGA